MDTNNCTNNIYNFANLFEYLNYCKDSTLIEIDQQEKVTLHHGLFSGVRLYFQHKTNENNTTVDKITQLVNDWPLFKKLDINTKIHVQANLIKDESGKLKVNAKVIRDIYRTVIQANTTPSLKDAILNSRGTMNIANRDVEAQLLSQWGEKRVARALAVHGLTLVTLKQETIPVRTIRKIYASLSLTCVDDLKETYELIKNYSKDKTTTLPTHLKNKYDEKKVKRLFSNDPLPKDFDQLNADQKKEIIRLATLTHDELETSLLGRPREGIVMGHRKISNYFRWIFSEYVEEREWIQTFQHILEYIHAKPNDSETIAEFSEILTKILIKKEHCRYFNHLHGRIVPGPNGEWYQIVETINIWGRFAFFMKPLCDAESPSHLVYRSTASATSSSTTLTSILQDIWKPGYLKFWQTMSKEVRFALSENNPLIVSGHSLGGDFAQLFIVFFAKISEAIEKDPTLKGTLNDEKLTVDQFRTIMAQILNNPTETSEQHKGTNVFHRDIKIIGYDCPGIDYKDNIYMDKLKSDERLDNLETEYHLSERDIVPYAGGKHLGSNWDSTESTLRVSKNKHILRINYNAHGNLYLTHPNYKALVTERTRAVQDIDNSWWKVIVEKVRALIGFFVWPIFYVLVLPKEIHRMWKHNYSWTDIIAESSPFLENGVATILKSVGGLFRRNPDPVLV